MKINNPLNDGTIAWARLLIYIAVTLITIGATYGRLSMRMDVLADNATAAKEEASVAKIEAVRSIYVVGEKLDSVNTRLSRIEGALGVKDRGDSK